MATAFLGVRAADHPLSDRALIRRFRDDPASAYRDLLRRHSPTILHAIRRFMRDPDEVMEVYTAVCERLRAHDYRALRGFRVDADLLPWLRVVAANACRDRLRKQRAWSAPLSVLSKLSPFETLVFTYHYRHRLPYEDICEMVGTYEGRRCTPLDVVRAVGKINSLLSVNKRWHLLAALNANRPALSIDEMHAAGLFPAVSPPPDPFGGWPGERPLRERLRLALENLESEDRLLVHLRYEHGMTAPQIAEVMHFDSYKHVYTRLRTVISRLRRSLARD